MREQNFAEVEFNLALSKVGNIARSWVELAWREK